jgi:hypothetical protein
MEELPKLSGLLDSPEDGTREALGRVLARHRQLRARRLRVVATSGVLLLGAGLGVGLSQAGGPSPGRHLAAGVNQPAAPARAGSQSLTRVKMAHFSYKPLKTLGASSGVFSAVVPSQPAVNSTSVCSVYACGAPLSPLHPLSVRRLGRLTITAFVVSPSDVVGNRQEGVTTPLTMPPGRRLCDNERALSIIVRQGGRWLGTAVVPINVGPVTGPIGQLSESAFSSPGKSTVLVATARVSKKVASVRAILGGGPVLKTRADEGFVFLARVVSPADAKRGVQMTALSGSGVALERASVPSPSLIGMPVGACPMPNS